MLNVILAAAVALATALNGERLYRVPPINGPTEISRDPIPPQKVKP